MVLIPISEAQKARQKAQDDARNRFRASGQENVPFRPTAVPEAMQGRPQPSGPSGITPLVADGLRQLGVNAPTPIVQPRTELDEYPEFRMQQTAPPRTASPSAGSFSREALLGTEVAPYEVGARGMPTRMSAPPTGLERALSLETLSRGSGAFLGSVAGLEDAPVWQAPLAAVRGAVEGFKSPYEYGGAESSLGQRLPEPARGIGGAVIETVFDPVDLFTGGTVLTDAARAGRGAIRSLSDDAAESAIRAAEGPLEASTNVLRRGPSPGAVDPVIPGVTPRGRALVGGGADVAEVADEAAPLLRPRGIEELGEGYTVRDALRVADDLRRQVDSQSSSLMAEAELAYKELGPTFTGRVDDSGRVVPDSLVSRARNQQGNTYFRNVTDASGNPALAQDVFENPGRYALTPDQLAAVQRFNAVPARVRAEAERMGVQNLREVGLEEGQNYVPRLGRADTKGVDLTQRQPGGGGLSTFRERSREFSDPLEATARGVVYENPLSAVQRYNTANLRGAAAEHLKRLYLNASDEAGNLAAQSPALRRSPELVQRWQSIRDRMSNLRQTARNQGVRGATQQAEATRAGRDASRIQNLAENAQGRADAIRDRKTVTRIVDSEDDMLEAYRLIDDPDGVFKAAERELSQLQRELSRTTARATQSEARAAATTVRHNRTVAELNTLADELASLRNEYDAMIRNTTAVPAGRARVDNAPALMGYDFPAKDANRLSAYYSQGQLPKTALGRAIRGLKGFSGMIVPMQAIGDASATLRQLATIIPNHPLQFARNFGHAGYESLFPGGWENYQRWLASDDVRYAASRGVSVVSESGSRGTDFYASWLNRVPVLKQAQRHFEIIGNRNRVDTFLADLDLLSRGGKMVDEEAIARNANRMTGIANGKASDLETLTEFAPNWMRARLETLDRTFRDGGVEGQLARKYLRNYVATGMIAVGGYAAATGRDLDEVLNPITVDDDGRWRLNPNFGTIRAGSQDVNLFGTYIDLARLAVMYSDAAVGAVREKDLTELFDPIIYTARTKGAPWITATTDIVSGRNIIGEDTRSWEYMLTRPAPITLANAVGDIADGRPAGEVALGTGIEFFGGSANPTSVTERLDEAARAMGFDENYYDLAPVDRQAVDDANPDLIGQRTEDRLTREGPFAQYEAAKVRYAEEQAADDAKFEQGTISPSRWIENLRERQVKLSAVGDTVFGDEERPVKTPRDAYFAAIDQNTDPAGEVNWDAVDEWYGQQSPEDQAYIDENTGLGGTEQVRAYNAARKGLDGTGYYGLRNAAWDALREQYPAELGDLPADYWQWRDAEVQEIAQAKRAEGLEPGIAYQEAAREVSGYTTVEVFNEFYRTEFRHQWVVDNPDLAREAWNLGLFTPDKAEREFLQGLREPVTTPAR